MEQTATRITFAELRKQPDGTEFNACFADGVKRGLLPVTLKKRSPRNYAERILDGVQILGVAADGAEHAFTKGAAYFSVTEGAAGPPAAMTLAEAAAEVRRLQGLLGLRPQLPV